MKNKFKKNINKDNKVSLEEKNINKDDVDSIDQKIISYSKFNPFIFKGKNSLNKKNNSIYNVLKFFIALSLGIFLLLSLWMTTIWQDKTISNLGINITGLNEKASIKLTVEQINMISNMKIVDMRGHGGNLSEAWLSSLIAFGFISLVTIIPVLLFKNGTIFSIVSISIGFVFLIILLSLFSYGISEQYDLIIYAKNSNIALASGSVSEINKYLDLIKIFCLG